ncbi:MAG: YncE family protein, partial [Acidimicrobiia bacterium]
MRFLLPLLLVASACTAASAETVATTAPATAATSTTLPLATTTTTSTTTTSTTTTTTAPPPTTSTTTTTVPNSTEATFELAHTVTGTISPKSVVSSGTGLFFAQNMMYSHTITVYDEVGELLATIPDDVVLSDHGFTEYEGSYRGAPVEVDFASDGSYAYVSNYEMYGNGFSRPGSDGCGVGDWDESFVYGIDTERLEITEVIAVGAVPKFLAVSPDDRLVVVSNWCSHDVSIIDTALGEETARIPIGRHPRGVAITGDSRVAYVAVMGGRDIAVVWLAEPHPVEYIRNVGASPRHLVLDPGGQYLYATLNGSGQVIKIDLGTWKVVGSVATGSAPRSMDIAADGRSLYVVNYNSNTVSKVR